MGKKEKKSNKRGDGIYRDDASKHETLNPTPTVFTFDTDLEDAHTLNPTPVDFNPDEHEDVTRNPTPQNFNVDYSPTHEDLKTFEPSYTPSFEPTYLPTTRPTIERTANPTELPTYQQAFAPTYEPTLSPIKHAENSLVSDIQSVIPSWNLNEGASWTVVIFFFLIMTCVCSLMVYNMFIKSPEKRKKRGQNSMDDNDLIISDTASNSMGESNPLLQSNKPSKSTMTRVSTVHSDILKEFLSNGKIIDLHTSKGKKTAELSLIGTEVKWKTVNDVFPKKFKLDLKTVYQVEMGKKTQNFKKSICSDDVCMSLVADKSTLDIEAKSSFDRDIMYQGFSEMVENMKDKV